MAIVDVIDLDLCLWVSKEEFLIQIAIFVNVLTNFLLYIRLTTIQLVGYPSSKMFEIVNPWEWVTTKVHARKLSLSSQECHAFSFALNWVWICGEFKIVCCCILLTGLEDILQ